MKEVEKVKEASGFLIQKGFMKPSVGIILGTGLGTLAEEIDWISSVDYTGIPHFPIATVEFHQGKLIYGKLEEKTVVAMQGRFHYYEGHSMSEVVFPVRVMKELGIEKLLISNAAGCMNPDWKKGELMLIEDHINLQPENPIRGKEATDFGPIFVDMSRPYDHEINRHLISIAQDKGIKLNKGIYVSVAGPHLETRAEYKFLRQIGADVVGMSTVPEVIAANQFGLPVSAVSVLTDDCDPDNLHPVDMEDIMATAKIAEKDLVVLYKALMKQL